MADSNRGAARYTAHYTEAERNAYLEAVITLGIKPETEVMRRAVAGTLKAGVGPFGKANKSGKLVFGYSITELYGEAYIARNPALQAEDTRATIAALHEANKREAKAIAESDTATMADRTKAAKELAESMKALASIQPRDNAREKPQASAREPENQGAEPDGQLAGLLALVNTSNTPSAPVNTPAAQQDEARGPVRSVAR